MISNGVVSTRLGGQHNTNQIFFKFKKKDLYSLKYFFSKENIPYSSAFEIFTIHVYLLVYIQRSFFKEINNV